jgi:N-acetylmuramoyl-L-alanine amidase
MANQQRLKRRIIRQVVQENLDTMQGSRRRHRRRLSHLALVTARVLFFVSLPAALFASTYVISSAADEWRRSTDTSSTQRIVSTRRPLPAERVDLAVANRAEVEFTIPEPIDPAVLPLALRTVILDPGHGGDNEGTKAPVGLVEKEVTLDIARRLGDLLSASGYKVVLTRDRDVGLSLRDRADLANSRRGDIFVSIHVNWLENRELRGLETFYLGPTDDPYLEALAARENQQSGYSLADQREILQKVYAGFRQEESRRLAESVQRSLFESLYQVDERVRDRGIKSAPFGVLTRTEMPAILAEVSSVSNEVESRLLMTSIYRQYLAEALFRGIESYSHSLLNRAHEAGG